MAIHGTGGTRLYIGPAVNVDTIEDMIDADAVSYFEGLAYVEVEEVESYGDLGDNSDVATFASVTRQRVRKLKTTRDAGMMAIVVGLDQLDNGQEALVAAEKTEYNFAFKIVYDDARDATFTNSVDYFGGTVMSRPKNLGGAGDVAKRTFNIGVNTAVYEVPTEASSVPANVTLPSIVGASVQVGVTLTAIDGTWSGDPSSLAYVWQHDVSGNGVFSAVAVGGTSRTYVPVVGDLADHLRVGITPTNGAGAGTIAYSLPVGPIIAA